MQFFDKIGSWINESCFYQPGGGSPSTNPISQSLVGFHAVDTPIAGGYSQGALGSTKRQFDMQAEWTLFRRNHIFNEIDRIANHHLATTIKDIIISDGFNDLCGNNAISILYRDDNKEKAERYSDDIKIFLKRTGFIDILKDCVANEGLNYGEIFLSTPVKNGYGVEYISDDLMLRELIGVYKNTRLLGAVKFEIIVKDRVSGKSFIPAEKISHFMLGYKKIPIIITKNFNKKYDIPEKIRCAYPILTPVIDLITQYNQLEEIRTALEINKATQPVVMGLGVSPNQDMAEIMREIQQWSVSLNKNRKNIVDNLNSLDVSSILQSMQQIQLVPYSVEEGTNSMRQVSITYSDSDLTDKINDLRKSIALAVGVPESYLTSSSYLGNKETKEDSLLTNPRYSRMLSNIQQLIAKGIIDLIYKHLTAKYTNAEGIVTQSIDREKIEVLFKSATNLNDRLEDENLLLNAETVGSLVNVIDTMAASPNIPLKVKGEKMLEFWKEQMDKEPHIRDMFELMTPEEQEAMYGNGGGGSYTDYDTPQNSTPYADDEDLLNAKNRPSDRTDDEVEDEIEDTSHIDDAIKKAFK